MFVPTAKYECFACLLTSGIGQVLTDSFKQADPENARFFSTANLGNRFRIWIY